ncbi:MAG: FAD-dependent oxidoreductase [Chloroflexi bacterium]|nr:FAD-dependent oxidoreductase [Chloroflexota bacterium]
MTERADVLIIGGGIIGVCAAHYLAERGRQVTLVEQGEIASGSSYGNAGLIVPSHSTPLAAPGALASGLKWMLDPESPFYIKPRLDLDLFDWLLKFTAHCTDAHARRAIPLLRDLSLASADLFDELAALDFHFGYSRKGLLLVYKTEEGLKHAIDEARLLAECGVVSKTLNANDVCALEPTVQSGMAGALYFTRDAHLNPAEFVRGLAEWVGKKGVRIHANTTVTGIEKAGRRIETVKTTNGDFQPSEVVVAAGAWSPGLARALDLRLPIQPAKGYSVTVKRPASCPIISMILGESRVAVTPMDSAAGPILRFAGTLELAGMDLTINQRRVNAIRRAANHYLVGMSADGLETVEVWGGLRPCSPDGLPFIARPAPFDNLTVAAGHAMIGISLGPITGKLVAQMVCGEKTAVDVTPLRVERF